MSREKGLAKVTHFSRVREKKRLRPWKRPRIGSRWIRRKLSNVGLWALILGGGAAVAYVGGAGSGYVGCDIKGNIAINTGERIYHLPGQKYYHSTRINPRYGERWFCSEEEARVAGWRKAQR